MAQLVVATFGVESDTTALLSSLLYLDLPKVFKDSFLEELFNEICDVYENTENKCCAQKHNSPY